MNNHAIGMIPLLVFMFLDNFLPYFQSFLIGVGFCFLLAGIFSLLRKDKIYLLMLAPTIATLVLYSFFLFFKIEPVLFDYTPLIVEVVLVVVLAVIGFTKRPALKMLRNSNHPLYRRTYIRTTLNEFFFLTQLVQGLYTLHLFIVLIYTTLPDTMQNERFGQFLYRELEVIIGVLVIVYEQIRLTMMRGSLRKEMWLPVLDDNNKVVGCIARSVARTLPKKFYHPIVRVAVVYDGMLYLIKRNKNEYVSPDTFDIPFNQYVLYHHTIDQTVKEALGDLLHEKEVNPRFLIRYTYEDEKVKHLVYLYVICLHSNDRYKKYKKRAGKLWTAKQIQENLNSGIFSSYFEKEFPYLQQTILYAENFCCGDAGYAKTEQSEDGQQKIILGNESPAS